MSPYLPLLLLASTVSAQATLQSVISTYGLTAASFNYTAPTRALESDDAYDWIKENWDLTGNKIDYGIDDMCVLPTTVNIKVLIIRAFTADPSTVSSTLVRRQSTRSSSASAASSSAASATGVQAPITTALSGEEPVFRVGYPAGSYSGSTGGTQFYSQALNVTNGGQDYERMMLSYDVWFPQGFA
jgi:hypothetical protein